MEKTSKMNIIEAMKEENLRISNGNRWMYFDQITYEWVVCERSYGKKKNKELFRGFFIEEHKAVKALLAD
jgi:hypothetical protein